MSEWQLPPEISRMCPQYMRPSLQRVLLGRQLDDTEVTDLVSYLTDDFLERVDQWGLACDIAEHALVYGQDLSPKVEGLKAQLIHVRQLIQGDLPPDAFVKQVEKPDAKCRLSATPVHSCNFASRAECLVQRAIAWAKGEELHPADGTPVQMARIRMEAVDRAGNLAEAMGLDRDEAQANERRWYVDQLRWRIVLTVWRRLSATPSTRDAISSDNVIGFSKANDIDLLPRAASPRFRFVLGDHTMSSGGLMRTIIGYGQTCRGEFVYLIWRHDTSVVDRKKARNANEQYSAPVGLDLDTIRTLKAPDEA